MSKYYNSQRTRNLFDLTSTEPYKLSRSKVEIFMQCPRCFYIDLRLGVGRPPGFPLTLNNAVDALMKKEFDIHRVNKTTHPLMKAYGIDAVPLDDPRMDEWRDALRRGVSYLHEPSNLILRGGVDDVWVSPEGELIVVDYKATSKAEEVTLDDEWKIQYKRQAEIYQWLFRQNGFKVSDTAYFVFVNGKTDKEALDGKLEFDVTVVPYKGNSDWVDGVLVQMKKCLVDSRIPKAGKDCDYCAYVDSLNKVWKKNILENGGKKLVEDKVEEGTLFNG
jgi:CRISPR/Cas system-associated exonuclease Cas4 (RecB family)